MSIKRFTNSLLVTVLVLSSFLSFVPAVYADGADNYVTSPEFISGKGASTFTKLAVDGSGNKVVWGVRSGIYIYDHTTKQEVKLFEGKSGTLARITISEDGKYASWLLYDSSNTYVFLADLEELEVEELYTYTSKFYSAIGEFSPDSSKVVYGYDTTLYVKDLVTGDIVKTIDVSSMSTATRIRNGANQGKWEDDFIPVMFVDNDNLLITALNNHSTETVYRYNLLTDEASILVSGGTLMGLTDNRKSSLTGFLWNARKEYTLRDLEGELGNKLSDTDTDYNKYHKERIPFFSLDGSLKVKGGKVYPKSERWKYGTSFPLTLSTEVGIPQSNPNVIYYVINNKLYRLDLSEFASVYPNVKNPAPVNISVEQGPNSYSVDIKWDHNPTAVSGYKVIVNGDVVANLDHSVTSYQYTHHTPGDNLEIVVSSNNSSRSTDSNLVQFKLPDPGVAMLGNITASQGSYVFVGERLWRLLDDNLILAVEDQFPGTYDIGGSSTTRQFTLSEGVGEYLNSTYFGSLSESTKALFQPRQWASVNISTGSVKSPVYTYIGLLSVADVEKYSSTAPFNLGRTLLIDVRSSSAVPDERNLGKVILDENGKVTGYGPDYVIRPLAHLKPNVLISAGTGSYTDPYFIDSLGAFVPAPTSLTAEEVTGNSVKLSWSGSSPLYEVFRNGSLVYTGADTTFTDVGLNQETTYTYSVRARDYTGSVSSPVTTSVTTLAGPITEAPNPFKIKGLYPTSIEIEWGAVDGATSYVLYRDGSVIYEGSDLSYTDTGLTPNTKYYYSIAAKNSLGEGPKAEFNTSTRPEAPKDTPNVSVVEVTDNSVELSWTPVDTASSYTVLRDGSVIYKGSNTSYTDVGLQEKTEYEYEVYSENITGIGPSSSVTATTLPRKLPATSDLTVTEATYEKVTLVWSPVVDATAYALDKDGSNIYTGTDLTFTDLNPTPGDTHVYTLAPLNDTVRGSEVSVSVKIPLGTPEVTDPSIVDFKAVTVDKKSITLSWGEIEDAESYVVIRSLAGSSVEVIVYEGEDKVFEDKNLDELTSYTYKLYGVNKRGKSDPISITVTTLPGDAPEAPNGFKANRVFSDGVSLQWGFVEGADYYVVYRDGVVIAYQGPSTTFRDITLGQNSTHTYKVVAVNKWGTSPESDEVTITTLEEVPSIVIVPSDNPPLSGQITFSFQIIEGAYEYHVERNPHWVYTDNGDGTFHLTYENTVTGATIDYGNVSPVNGKLGFFDDGVDPGNDYHYDVVAVRKKPDGSDEIIGHTPVEITTPSDGSGVTIDQPIGDDDSSGGTPGGGTPGGGTPGGSNPGGGTPGGGSGGSGSSGSGGSGGSSGGSSGSGGSGGSGSDSDSDSEGSEGDNTGSEGSKGSEGTGSDEDGKGSEGSKKPSDAVTDIDDSWARDEIIDLLERGIVTGKPGGIFAPNDPVTREEFTVMVYRALNLDEVNEVEMIFPDITASNWSHKEVYTSNHYGLVLGYGDGYFYPTKEIPREQLLSILSRVLRYKGIELDTNSDSLSKFNDSASVSDWAVPEVASMVNVGIVTGTPEGNIEPHKLTTRAEAAVLIYRVLSLVE